MVILAVFDGAFVIRFLTQEMQEERLISVVVYNTYFTKCCTYGPNVAQAQLDTHIGILNAPYSIGRC